MLSRISERDFARMNIREGRRMHEREGKRKKKREVERKKKRGGEEGERLVSYLSLALGAPYKRTAVYILIIIITVSWSQSTRIMKCFPTSVACVHLTVTDKQCV